jgi:NADH-quinone oxidoreductase subunit M
VRKRTNTFEMSEMGGLADKTPLLACFCIAATLATIGLPGFGNFWGEFGIFLSLGELYVHQIFLVLAALGIIISAVFGLRAVAKIFFGKESEELSKQVKKSSVSDLSRDEIIPAALILSALLLIGLWPSSISERIDSEIGVRYSHKESKSLYSKPSCCPVDEDVSSSPDVPLTSD